MLDRLPVHVNPPAAVAAAQSGPPAEHDAACEGIP